MNNQEFPNGVLFIVEKKDPDYVRPSRVDSYLKAMNTSEKIFVEYDGNLNQLHKQVLPTGFLQQKTKIFLFPGFTEEEMIDILDQKIHQGKLESFAKQSGVQIMWFTPEEPFALTTLHEIKGKKMSLILK